MNKADIIDKVSKETGYSKQQVRDIFNGIISVIQKSLVFGMNIKMKGFMNMTLKIRKPRVIKNPQNGEDIVLPKQYYVWIDLPKAFKKKIADKTVY